jgi:hypothetical protein
MDVQQIEFSPADALVALREYKEHRGNYDKHDMEIERVYRAISRGKTVISARNAIQRAGRDEQGRPRLAISRADARAFRCSVERSGRARFFNWSTRWNIEAQLSSHDSYLDLTSVLPRIPPKYRPKNALYKYWILWEADWQAMPTDPYLLRRLGEDAWIVLAAWELTPVEVAVLRATQ